MTAPLEAKIEIKGKFKVGSLNEFTLVVTNPGIAIVFDPQDSPPHLYLTGSLGPGEEALFLTDKAADDCVKSVPRGWQAQWDFSDKDKGIFRLDIYTFKTTAWNTGKVVEVKLSQVESKTAPGEARLTFKTEDADAKPQQLSIMKIADGPSIISFYSDPPEGVQNLPGQNVTLKWLTYELPEVELKLAGRSDPIGKFGEDKTSYTARKISTSMRFELTGYSGTKKHGRILDVSVLSAGWYDVENTLAEGDIGYPRPANEEEAADLDAYEDGLTLEPTQLFNVNDQRLYGIFRYTWMEEERAFLFQTENPLAPWNLVKSSVEHGQGFIPAGFSTSPGIYCVKDKKLWLIGGSQIDPDNTSNEIWCLDTQKEDPTWEYWGEAGWCERMGHAVVVFKDEIWVMGGRDTAGNPLNDVWTLQPGKVKGTGNPKWERVTERAWETGRCVFHPAVMGKEIWLYGGVKEPFGDESYNDLYRYTIDGRWKKQDMTGIIQNKEATRPIASCLQLFQKQLRLFAKFRTIDQSDKSELLTAQAFSLTNPNTRTWQNFPDSDGLQGWGSDTTFSYQLVNFQDKMLVAKALGYDQQSPTTVLKVYVPAKGATL